MEKNTGVVFWRALVYKLLQKLFREVKQRVWMNRYFSLNHRISFIIFTLGWNLLSMRMFPISIGVTTTCHTFCISSNRNWWPCSPPVLLSMNLHFPESVFCLVTSSLEEIIVFESVNSIMVVSSPCPGHFFTCKIKNVKIWR